MSAWPVSTGEALHTQTYLGHPAGCAAALAVLSVVEDEALVERARKLGDRTREQLEKALATSSRVQEIRGRGMMLGIACRDAQTALDAWREILQRGVITLPCGSDGDVLSITPPLCIDPDLLQDALERVCESLR